MIYIPMVDNDPKLNVPLTGPISKDILFKYVLFIFRHQGVRNEISGFPSKC